MLPFKSLRTLNFEDANLRSMQNATQEAVNPLLQIALLDHTVVTSVALGTSPLAIPHRLNRAFTGYIVTLQDANAVIYSLQADQRRPLNELVLRASGAVTVNLVVF